MRKSIRRALCGLSLTFGTLLSVPSLAQSSGNQAPFGWVDTQALGSVPSNSTVRISGWAADQLDGAPVTRVQLVLDGATALGDATLGFPRADVASYLSDTRFTNSGWSFTYNPSQLTTGEHRITATAYDSTGTAGLLSGTAAFTVTSPPPFGWVDSQSLGSVAQNTSIQVSGWAADQQDGSPIAQIQIVLDGTAVVGNAQAGFSRSDVASAFNDARYANSGWVLTYNVGALSLGQHALTAVAYDSTGASAQLRGAAVFIVTSTAPPAAPFGWLDAQSKTTVVQNTTVSVSGWAADPQDGSPVTQVQLLLDGTTVIGNAELGISRADVRAYFGDTRYENSGWQFSYSIGTLAFGHHTLTAVALDSSGTTAQLLGSASFTVPDLGPVVPTDNPQVAAYSIAAPDGSSVSVDFGSETTYGLQTSAVPAPAGGGTVRVLVAGMKANTSYHMRAVIHAADESVSYDSDHTFTTSAYSSDLLPTINVTHFNATAEAPGVQMLDCLNLGKLSLGVVDRDGNVIWAYTNSLDTGTYYFPPKPLPNGNFLLLVNAEGVREVDLSGVTVHEFSRSQVQNAMVAAGYQYGDIVLHHDLQKLSNGHYVLLGQITRNIVLNGNSSPTNVTGDILIDLDPNLNVTWVWNSFDHLDVNRHPVLTTDWTHGNAVVLTSDGNLLLSMRHQSWIIKIDYQNGAGTGNVLWRLGYQGDFALQSSTVADWFYMQHYPNILSEQNGTMRLAIFDNGDNRLLDLAGDMCGMTGQIACYSRAVVMDLDETNMTATVEYQHTLSEYSFWGGSVQQTPNGNYVVGMSATSLGSRAEEFTGDSAQSPVWQMDVIGQGAALYRSLRLPSLYSGVQWP